ncbi:MAG: ribonuclease III [Elusimicrobia bacterium]|nr:ribonuclease III [Elusimicrobiota bacterium]
MPDASLSRLEKSLGYHFQTPALRDEALTHKSHASGSGNSLHNERLEFLGDSVLSVVVAHYLFQRFPRWDEGRLSKLKSLLVSRSSLAEWARKLDLGTYLRLSPGESSSGGRERESLLANVFEAVLGAMFLEKGLEPVEKLVRKYLDPKKRFVETDHKSKLQEMVQSRYQTLPAYTVLGAIGPDHDKTFETEVRLKKKRVGIGSGKSKKEAEQAAAKDALQNLKIQT